ncbi:MAG TPA: ABC transporter permease [Flavisolibacter sp.]|nr:ABC transporter permease [Flavisolibacter sp.]
MSYRTVRSNKLRTGLTVAIIAFGIMALIGIITAIEAMNQKLTESFSTMGANGFTVRYRDRNIRFGNNDEDLKVSKKGAKKQKQSSLNKVIKEDEADQFVKYYHFPSVIGVSTMGGNNFIASYQSHKTSPNVLLFGADENYLDLNGFTLRAGRNFSIQEIQSSQNTCLLGYDVANKLFKLDPNSAVSHVVRINDLPYKVIGVLNSRGSSFGFSRDNIIVIGYKNIKKYFGVFTYTIGVKTDDVKMVNVAMGEAESTFRAIRKLSSTEESNFVLERSDSVAEKAMSVLSYLTAAVIVIGFITLIGSAIGLMNIMLVSVTERTKEVGLIKAIGGRSSSVRQQFLSESIIISVLGAIFGIILGILIGNLFSMLLQTGFVVPWKWVLYGIIICSVVGLLAGLYPALKAGKLNPIDALRYE